MANDKPNISLTLAALEAEVAKPEPFVLALKGGKRITFPDLYDMPAVEAKEFFDQFEGADRTDFSLLEQWLSKPDYEAYVEARLPLRVHAALVERVMAYYQQTVGTPGEGAASKS
ncbi:hypothetical protein [Arthrobacter sp. FW306-2-2C-D06B]|uniref:hypothetical protein n=1 Tax=Arthrobacter sp. FW306-2-2C-D06B TaxID=2879618 RepID=UPI001F46A0EA|nr:hypothetical protein [Arthrobacter sp. FW306-2-2C-D06B]UKA59157.1 hypothetical protein LFT47_02035 [Arthrobacter sp. FW306-2-2C-D06B]